MRYWRNIFISVFILRVQDKGCELFIVISWYYYRINKDWISRSFDKVNTWINRVTCNSMLTTICHKLRWPITLPDHLFWGFVSDFFDSYLILLIKWNPAIKWGSGVPRNNTGTCKLYFSLVIALIWNIREVLNLHIDILTFQNHMSK